ncbi:MAG: tetratricopeptide repeat protein, partial [Opitutaceae bacterium]|nr:tetratricopeptide repeat protein [Opitutaceae bacterium]
YSLGVLLYELLTGTTPFDAGELLQLGVEEVRRAIREREPLPPSARLGRMTGEELTAVAKRRRAEPPTLVRTVRGDLDWIAMKALEKDRARRYPTANDLAADVTRFLVDEPVWARPATALYRLRKTVARHKLLFAGSTAVALLVVGALLAVSVAFARERRARAEAEAAREQAEVDRSAAQEAAAQSRETTGLLVRTFETVNPGNAKGKDTALLRLVLDDAAKRIDTELAKYPGPRHELQSTIGSVYANLDLFDAAVPLLEASVRSARERYGPADAQVADASEKLGHLWMKMNRYQEADAAYREALEIQRKIHGDKPHPDVADLLRALGGPAWGLGRLDQAETYARQAWTMLQATVGEDHRDSRSTMNSLAALTEIRLNLVDAEALQRKLAAYHRTQPNKVFLANTLDIIGRILGKGGRPNHGVEWATESLQVQREVGDAPSFMRVRTQRNLSHLYLLADRLPEAEKALADAEATLRAMPATESADLALTLDQRALLAERLGRLEEAEQAARREWDVVKKMRLEHLKLDWLESLTSVLVAGGRTEEAEALFTTLPATVTTPESKNDSFFSARSLTRARLGRWSEALADARLAYQFSPTDPLAAWRLTPLLVVTSDRAGYVDHVAAILKEFGQTRTPVVALRVAFDALILPDAAAEVATTQRLADTALGGEMEGNWAAHAELVKALAEYRSGNFAAAQTWSDRAIRSLRPDLRAMALSLRALSLHQQHHPAEAAAALAQAQEVVAALLPHADAKDFGAEWREHVQGDGGADWKGWIYSHTLLSEAKRVIAGAKPGETAAVRPRINPAPRS